jgi:hypothetical protein
MYQMYGMLEEVFFKNYKTFCVRTKLSYFDALYLKIIL